MNSLEIKNYGDKKRYGSNGDGGYVIAQNLPSTGDSYDCYISAGIASEESFTRDFLYAHAIEREDCYAFDGTINDYPWSYTTNINFIRKNIGKDNTNTTTNLHSLIDKYDNIFLKMDIEGGEYPWLDSISMWQLDKFKQIVIEFHNLTKTNKHLYRYFTKLANTHIPVHAHGNSCCPLNEDGVPHVLEITYINKKCVHGMNLGENTYQLPTPGLDYSNMWNKPDLNLNHYPFYGHRKFISEPEPPPERRAKLGRKGMRVLT